MMNLNRTRNLRFSICFAAMLSLVTTNVAMAESCDAYPYLPLENVIEFEGKGRFKILATASASVTFDEPTEVMSARREAELLAKRSIAEYINQRLTSEDSISSEIQKSKTNTLAADGSRVSAAQRDEVKKQLSAVTTRADAVLKGVTVVGSCYTKGREMRVTVGVKSDTVNNAMNLETLMGAGRASTYGKQSNSQAESPKDQSKPSRPETQGYDASNQLKKF